MERDALTIVLVGHLLTAREVQAHQCTQADEGGEIEDEEQVLGHAGAQTPLKPPRKTTRKPPATDPIPSRLACQRLDPVLRWGEDVVSSGSVLGAEMDQAIFQENSSPGIVTCSLSSLPGARSPNPASPRVGLHHNLCHDYSHPLHTVF